MPPGLAPQCRILATCMVVGPSQWEIIRHLSGGTIPKGVVQGYRDELATLNVKSDLAKLAASAESACNQWVSRKRYFQVRRQVHLALFPTCMDLGAVDWWEG